MTWDITDRFPNWGENGESPPTGFFYEGGDQVNEKHLDYLWNSVKGLEDDVQSALNDIDNDSDGKVDSAETADSATSATDATNVTSTYKGNDIDSDGDGKVDSAETADSIPSIENVSSVTKITSGSATVSSGISPPVFQDYSKSKQANLIWGMAVADPESKSSVSLNTSGYGFTNPDRESQVEGNIGYKIQPTNDTNNYDLRVTNLSTESETILYAFYEVEP